MRIYLFVVVVTDGIGGFYISLKEGSSIKTVGCNASGTGKQKSLSNRGGCREVQHYSTSTVFVGRAGWGHASIRRPFSP